MSMRRRPHPNPTSRPMQGIGVIMYRAFSRPFCSTQLAEFWPDYQDRAAKVGRFAAQVVTSTKVRRSLPWLRNSATEVRPRSILRKPEGPRS